MDSLSQVVLGAITFALVKDKEIGKKSLLYGAVLGTIPDLDVLLNPFFDSVEQLAIHRAFSHSIFFSILLSLLAAKWFSKKYNSSYISWVWACFLALFTHPLLDICTTYGTRILYPLTKSYYSLNNIFCCRFRFYTSSFNCFNCFMDNEKQKSKKKQNHQH
jgi:inner membrane protein